MKNTECTVIVYFINHNLLDEKRKEKVTIGPREDDSKKEVRDLAQRAIEANLGKYALGYYVEIFNDKGILQDAFLIEYGW